MPRPPKSSSNDARNSVVGCLTCFISNRDGKLGRHARVSLLNIGMFVLRECAEPAARGNAYCTQELETVIVSRLEHLYISGGHLRQGTGHYPRSEVEAAMKKLSQKNKNRQIRLKQKRFKKWIRREKR